MKNINITHLKCRKHFMLLVWLLACSLYTFSQSLDSKGTDFWLAFPGNLDANEFKLFISSEQNTSGTVTIPGIGFSAPFTVTVGNVTTVVLPTDVEVTASNVVANRGVHVVAANEITVYGLSRRQFTSDAFLGLPTDVLGNEYINLGYKNTNVVNGTQFAIVAPENGTTVTITPTVTTDGHAAGVPYNIALNQGQAVLVRNTGGAPSDLSGTIITSNKPVAVFGSHQCANIPQGEVACDFVIEQLPPISTWGKNFVTVPLKTRRNGDTFRFLASTNSTEVRVNGAVVANLNRGQLFETLIVNASQITSNQPILVAQYSNGTSFDGVTSDPFMMLIPPSEQFLGNYTFATPSAGFTFNFVNVVAPPAAIGALRLDGTVIPSAAFTPIGSSGFSGAQLDLSPGTHLLNGTNLPFGIFVYGFDAADSYGYPGGQSFGAVATVTSVSSITAPPSGTSPVLVSNCFSVTVRDQFSNPVPGVRVDFIITGTNPGSTGFAFTNGSGVASYCYNGPNPGTDNIVASVGTISSPTASFIWTPVNSNAYYSKATGDLHNLATWGTNPDGSGTPPPNFGAGLTFNLANRTTTYNMTADWTVEGTIVIPTGARLSIQGFTLTESKLDGAGNLAGSTTSNLVIAGSGGDAGLLRFASGWQTLNNLTINRVGASPSASLTSALSIYGVLWVTSGTFNTNNNLTLKSTMANTARVAPVMGTINGNVTVERFIPARRAWRILSAPVGGSQSINSAWQEGVTTSSPNPNPNPGFGTHITEGSAAQGFDHNPAVAMTSVLRYVSATDSWVALSNTNATAVNANAYMLFVRGDRGVALNYNNVPPTNTVLRAMGPLKVGDQMFNVAASGFTAIPNPFASPINFATLTRTNVQNNFYVWDPKLGGAGGVGGYVLLSFNGSGYDITPAPVSPESQYIQSGQGFLVHSTGATGSLVIKESDKSATAATNVFRSSNTTMGLRATLQIVNKDRSIGVIDEAFTSYGTSYSNSIDNMDAIKMPNINENLGMTRAGNDLMVERRSPVNGNDTIFLKLWNTEQRDYVLKLTPLNLGSLNLTGAYLVDNYLNTTTAIDVQEGLTVRFSVGENKASGNAQRFMVVLAAPKAINTDITIKQGMFKMTPNPASGRMLQLQFINQPKGQYQFEVVNSLGQVVYKNQYKHAGGSSIVPIRLDNALSKGLYQVHVTNTQANIKTALSLISN